jgi:hypothetical protein
MMLTNQVKENVVARMGLVNHEITFHSESENSFLICISDDVVTTIVRVKDFGRIIALRNIVVSIHHDRGMPASGLEILNSLKNAIAETTETGKGVIIMKS